MSNSYSGEQPKQTKVMQPTSSGCENPISPQQQQPDMCRQHQTHHQSATASVHHANLAHQAFKGADGHYKEMGIPTISSTKMSHSMHSAMNHAMANDQSFQQQAKLNNNQISSGNAMKNVQTNLGEPD